MTCVLCGAALPAGNPGRDTHFLRVDGVTFGACPLHFPPDSAGDPAYLDAQDAFVAAAVERLESEAIASD